MLYKEVIAVFVRIVGIQRKQLGVTYRTGVQLSYVTIWTILSKQKAVSPYGLLYRLLTL